MNINPARAVIFYMAANNNLRADAIRSLEGIEQSIKNTKGTVLVYIKTAEDDSYLLRIHQGQDQKTVRDTLKIYGNENSSDPVFMKRVLLEATEVAKEQSYGLVLWSHASSWIPPIRKNATISSYGYDRGTEMDIRDLKSALPDNLDFILFDACSMGSVEVIYELKEKANYIIASPTEILSNSYPYDQITPYLFGDLNSLKKASSLFLDYYRSLPNLYKSATIAIIDTRELNKLAALTKTLLDLHTPLADFNRNSIQRLDFERSISIPAYDFLDFMNKNYDTTFTTSVISQLEKTVIFSGHTDDFLGNPIKEFSGLSIYLPLKDDLNEKYYSQLGWYNASGFYNLFKKSTSQ